MNTTYSINGGMFSGDPIWSAINNMSGGGAQRPGTINYMTDKRHLKPIQTQQGQQPQMPSYTKQPFTPNMFTQAQLSGLNETPQWMMDDYTRKIGQMGGNANLPPFGVTQSGFPNVGMAPVQPVPAPTPQPTPGQGGKTHNPALTGLALNALNGAGNITSNAMRTTGGQS